MEIQLNNPCKAINRGPARISVPCMLIENNNEFYFHFAILQKYNHVSFLR